jgi:DNA repair exonuclease SbcCD ATPase subunit
MTIYGQLSLFSLFHSAQISMSIVAGQALRLLTWSFDTINLVKEERDISRVSSLTVNPILASDKPHTIMKLKNLRKKIQRLEKRLQDGPKKLAKLREKLQAAEAAKAAKARKKAAARAAAKSPKPIERKAPAQTAQAKKSASIKKAKKKLNLSPERRAQLASAMKARWAAKKAAEAKTASSDNQHFPPGPAPQAPENRPDGV